jgi:plastocyanin
MKKIWMGCVLVLLVLMIVGCKPSEPVPICGDKTCNVQTETTANCPGDCPAAAKETRLYVDPATVNVNNGETVSLDFYAGDVSNLLGYQFDLAYDPAILEFQGMTDGKFLSNNGNYQVYCIDYKQSAGMVKNIICAKLGEGGLNGTGLLKTITFKAIASGQTDITLSNAKLADSKANDIKFTVANGKVVVQ